MKIFLICLTILGLFSIFGTVSLGAGEDSPFGVCVDAIECKDAKVAGLINETGIGWVRQQVRWDLIEPVKGKFYWEDFDRAIDNERKSGLNVYGLLHWKSWSDPTTGQDEAIKNWANFVSMAVQRYKDKIKYWEVWNEEDYEGFWDPPNAANYVKLLKATYAAAKKADPECKIISGGLMGWGSYHPPFPFIDEMYKNGARGYFDILAFHPYSMPDAPDKNDVLKKKIEDVLARLKANGDPDRPLWITELGWPTNKEQDPSSQRSVTERQQAQYLAKAFEICLLYPQIKKIFWYGFRDVGVNPLDSEHHYGLVKNDFTPKPSYIAYKELISRFKK